MQIVAEFKIAPLSDVMESRQLQEGGDVQCFIDSECIRLMDDYTPRLNGALVKSVRLNSVIGSGRLVQSTPYARYLYHGKLMVDPITGKGSFFDPETGRHWSRPGVSKVLTDKDLKFNQTRSPDAGPHWFDRMVKDHGEEIGQGAAKIAGGRLKSR